MVNRAVAFCVKGTHMMLTATAITSLVKNYQAVTPMKILVLIEDVYQDDVDFIRSIPNLYGRTQISVDFWQPPYEFMNHVSEGVSTGPRLPKMTLWRLFLPYYFSNYDQLAYLDNDILLTTDINDLFDQLATTDTLGGVLDYEDVTRPQHNRAKDFFLPDTSQYINSGVFVTNIAAYQNQVPSDKMLELINKRNYPYGDQSILNIAFYNHIHLLPWRFNLQYDERLLKKFEPLAPIHVSEISEQLNHPGIIHFAANGYFPYPWVKFTAKTKWERMWWETFIDIKRKQLETLS
ncbi:glycosyltransferase [Lacticaseibacillus paracasei]|uniref:glycosyltransferase n=1 Tax=Lacticaseibacillus paracasei TaxID=1597 RepID=UPI001C4772B8|nr:glycosyltransferase [Lacticaseibacillus paracasei]MCU6430271.1 glycosyl transferase [Lacticaseibacillus paracasei]QXJ68268.1 glycosyl transferase [Lacticaseibacillus paracasei subsp. paracasei]